MRQDQLDPEDAARFIRLHRALTFFANEKLGIVRPPDRSEGLIAFPIEVRIQVRDALVDNLRLIDAFVEENPYGFGPDDLDLVRSWKDLVAAEFDVQRFLKNHAVFLTAKRPVMAYGVVALTQPFEELIDRPLPYYCKAVLHPFKGRIVYDGMLEGYNVMIGGNMTRELVDEYRVAKEKYGVVSSLPWSPETTRPPTRLRARTQPSKKGSKFAGRWRIVWLEHREKDFEDEQVGGELRFDRKGTGLLRFEEIEGEVDFRAVERDGKPAVEFSWLGVDGLDQFLGRGWAVREGDEIEGRIFIHLGKDSAFRAVKIGRRG
jgi:hypothetical protein